MNWIAIEPGLRAIFDACAGLPSGTTQIDSHSFTYAITGTGAVQQSLANVTCDVLSVNGRGFDEWRNRYDPNIQPPGDTFSGPGAPLGSVVIANTGVRELHVQVKVECYDFRDGARAWPILERIRTRLGLPTITEALDALGLGYQNIGRAQPADYGDDNGRRVSCAWFEIIFNATDSEDDDPRTTIETVEVPVRGAGLTVST